MIGAKPLRIRFDTIYRFVRVYNKTKNLDLFRGEKYDFIYNRMKYYIGLKSGIRLVISHNYIKIKVDSFHSLLLEKTF